MATKDTLIELEDAIRLATADLRDMHPLKEPGLWDAKVEQISSLRCALYVLFPASAQRWTEA